MNRNIIFTRKDMAEVLDGPMPEAGEGEVLVRVVRSCVSSGTERANLTGVPDNATSITCTASDDRVTWPRQLGYSTSGVVERVGGGVSRLKAGDRVAMSWTVHARYVCVPEDRAYPIPENVSLEAAAFAHIATFPLAAIRKCRLEIGESALVMGQGVLGQLAVKLLKAAGAAPVIAADPLAAKREQALRLGADFAFDPLAPDFAECVKSVTDLGRRVIWGKVDDRGAKVAIEVTGSGTALNTTLDAVAPYARVALLGCSRDLNLTVDYYHKVHGRGVTLVGAHTLARPCGESAAGWWTTRDDAQAFLRLLSLGRLSLDGFTDEVHKVGDAPAVYARLAVGGAFPIVQFNWEEES